MRKFSDERSPSRTTPQSPTQATCRDASPGQSYEAPPEQLPASAAAGEGGATEQASLCACARVEGSCGVCSVMVRDLLRRVSRETFVFVLQDRVEPFDLFPVVVFYRDPAPVCASHDPHAHPCRFLQALLHLEEFQRDRLIAGLPAPRGAARLF